MMMMAKLNEVWIIIIWNMIRIMNNVYLIYTINILMWVCNVI